MLDTVGGKSLLRSTSASLAVGPSVLTVDFETDAIQQLREDGPYELALMELLFLGPAGARSADRLRNVGQTQPYLLSEFEQPLLALTGRTSDEGIDDDGNGFFDRLLVSVEVNVVEAGSHSWSLTDQNLNEIDVAAASGTLVASINNIQVSFQGVAVSSFGADGPFLLRDLALFGPSASLLATEVGQTQAFLATDFEQPEGAVVPFAGIDVEVQIEEDEFDVEGTFTLGTASDGIEPLSEDVILKVGTSSTVIPAGSFELDDGAFEFEMETNGTEFELEITPLGADTFGLEAESEGADLTGTVNPVEVTVMVGNDAGTVSVIAEFDDDDDDSDDKSKDDDSSDDDSSS